MSQELSFREASLILCSLLKRSVTSIVSYSSRTEGTLLQGYMIHYVVLYHEAFPIQKYLL